MSKENIHQESEVGGTSSQGSEGAPRLDDGGPAFPLPDWANIPWPAGTPSDFGMGLSLRDYFAAKAMAGEFAAEVEGVHEKYFALVAGRAYKMADAMLAARAERSA